MTGGPSQIDLFDPKPVLNTLDGQPLPPSFGKIHSQFLESDPLCLGIAPQVGQVRRSRAWTCPTWCRTCTSTPTTSP